MVKAGHSIIFFSSCGDGQKTNAIAAFFGGKIFGAGLSHIAVKAVDTDKIELPVFGHIGRKVDKAFCLGDVHAALDGIFQKVSQYGAQVHVGDRKRARQVNAPVRMDAMRIDNVCIVGEDGVGGCVPAEEMGTERIKFPVIFFQVMQHFLRILFLCE